MFTLKANNADITVDKELLIKMSPFVRELKELKDTNDLLVKHKPESVKMVVKYINYWGAKKASLTDAKDMKDLKDVKKEDDGTNDESAPAPPIPAGMTLSKMLGTWDCEFLEQVKKDLLLPDMCGLAEFLGMENLLKKLALTSAFALSNQHGLEGNALAEAIAKLSVVDNIKPAELKDMKDSKDTKEPNMPKEGKTAKKKAAK